MTEHLFRSLKEMGHDVEVVERRFSKSVSEVGRFSLRKMGSAVWMPVRLLSAVTVRRPDVVIFFVTNRTFSFLVDVLLTGVLRLTKTPRILYVHTSGWQHLSEQGKLLRSLARFTFDGARAVVTLGPRLGADLRGVAGDTPVRFVANTTRTPARRRISDVLNEPLTVRYISNLIPAKGVIDFIHLAEILISEGFPIRFEIYGAAADAAFHSEVEARVSALGSEQLTLRGHVSNERHMARILESTDVLVFPSVYEFEAQPLTIVEAMANGVVVAAYDVGGVADVASKEHAFVASPAAVHELAGFVRRMHEDRSELSRLSLAAQAHFDQHLSPARFNQEWASVLEEGNCLESERSV
ncbi:glycosyltransferase family 4 protein [Microbacterium sp. Leaf203]|uniref:glycosyltransferase family 4 protein n=1 Tax=Microbacterium sp. Leaf203 TaxID=1735677 RepID=UPI0009EC406B|nr:glycosyltransferase family 4 protein [Microbacterium sp. Leaf203]